MISIPFSKMQATGNDFIIIDWRKPLPGLDLRDLSLRLANRHLGVGADQILYFDGNTQHAAHLRIFNADGSEAEMSGNGMRCFAKYLFDNQIVREKTCVVETLAGLISATLVGDSSRDEISRVRVDMGPARYLGRHKIVAEAFAKIDHNLLVEHEGRNPNEIWLHQVSLGNPHAVVFVHDVTKFPVNIYGPIIENHPHFPNRTNVEFVSVPNEGQVEQRTWERGAAETLACGTGACAVAKTVFETRVCAKSLNLQLRGGVIQVVEDAASGHMVQTGEACLVFTGDFILQKT